MIYCLGGNLHDLVILLFLNFSFKTSENRSRKRRHFVDLVKPLYALALRNDDGNPEGDA